MKDVKIFDPSGIRAAEYRSRYPELKRIKEFEPLGASELIFVWYYANLTSNIIDIKNDMERVTKALELSRFTPTKAERNDIINLDFPEKLALAIDRMRRMEPDARFKARRMIEMIISNYENMCNRDHYKEKDEDGNFTGDVDITKYVNATTKIAQELPNMIAKLEEGFGVSSRSNDESESSTGYARDWYQEQSEKYKI